MIEELDADGLPGIAREVKRHLYPDFIVRRVHEKLLQHMPAAIDHIGLLPAIRTRVVTGRPVIETEIRASRVTRNVDHLVRNGVTLLTAAVSHL